MLEREPSQELKNLYADIQEEVKGDSLTQAQVFQMYKARLDQHIRKTL